MTPERWQQIQPLLHAALELPVDERPRFVAGACAGDPDLQRELDSLLVEASGASHFLRVPALALFEMTAPEGVTLVGRQLRGRFVIKARLGAGGMGDVYLADDTQLRCPVALKALREHGAPTPDGAARLLREARAAAALRDHPHIAAIYDVLDADDAGTPPLIVMEFVEGETLSDLLKRGPLPAGDALRFGRDIADALAAAHHRGIVHCDLKPANLRINGQGRIKVLDFGLAHRMTPVADTSTMTLERAIQTVAAQRIAGTPGYMSPEQVLGKAVEPPTDIFSLGVVLFEMLTGRRPFPGNDFLTAGIAMMTMSTPRVADVVPGIMPAIDELLSRMLAREAAMRPSAADVAEEVSALLQPGGASAMNRGVRIGTAVMTFPAWRRLVIPVGVVVLLAASAIGMREPLRRRLGFGVDGPPPRISLALLPVDSPGGDTRGTYLGAGLTSLIAANFGSVSGLTVLSRSATVRYVKDDDHFLALQQGLGVTHVLQLSWRSVEPILLLRARIYAPGVAEPKWDETFRGDALGIERDVLLGLAQMLETDRRDRPFTANEWNRLRKLPTMSAPALMAYAEATAELDRGGAGIDRAVTLLQHAVTLDPEFVFAWAALGDSLWRRYVRDKSPETAKGAEDALRRALALDPDGAPVHYALGDMQYRTGQPTQAEASLRRALQLQPDFELAQRDLAQVLADTGRLDEAEGLLKETIRVSKNWNNYFMLGSIDYRAGRYPSAIDAFTRATEAAPNNAATYTMLGTTQYVIGSLQQAVGNFEHAVRLGPTAATHANLALAYYDAGRLEDALHSYEEALRRDPKSVVNHRNIGDVKARLGRLDDARADYERAIAFGNELLAVNPRDVRTIGLVALSEAKLGRRAMAERHAAEAVAVDSSSREAWQRSAEVHALLDQPEAALRDLEIAVARGFEPRMARRDDELKSLQKRPQFDEILKHSPGNAAKPAGDQR
jgi:serine/threonine-protein kinase